VRQSAQSRNKARLAATVRDKKSLTKAKLGGTDVGTIEIDPYAFGVTVGHRF